MRFFEFKPLKPLTPDQARIAALKRNVDNARNVLKRERNNQKIKKMNSNLKKINFSL